jgi:hypothetical protein
MYKAGKKSKGYLCDQYPLLSLKECNPNAHLLSRQDCGLISFPLSVEHFPLFICRVLYSGCLSSYSESAVQPTVYL